jgi:hypothetical protein
VDVPLSASAEPAACRTICSKINGAPAPMVTAPNGPLTWLEAATAVVNPALMPSRMITDTRYGPNPGSSCWRQGHPLVRRIAPANSKPSTAKPPNRPHSAYTHSMNATVRGVPQRGTVISLLRPQGDFLYVPQGGVHGFSNESGVPARMLILFAPGPPREDYFTELADIRSSGRTMTGQDWIAVWARHDQYPA